MRAVDLTALAPGATYRCEVVIVGAGPAGLSVAAELTSHGIDVLLVEAGPEVGTDELDNAWEEESTGQLRTSPISSVRNYGVGGTSRTWSGRLAELDDLDFTTRPWIPASGWPISRDNLLEYYGRARSYLESGATDQATLRRAAGRGVPVATDDFEPFLWTFSRTEHGDFVRFGPRALGTAGPGICFTSARVIGVRLNENGDHFDHVVARGRDGRDRTIRAKIAVLCAGAVESTRILLHSAAAGAAGRGHENVGRYLMDHPRGRFARFAPADHAKVNYRFASIHRPTRGHRAVITPGLALTTRSQRRHSLSSAAVWPTPLDHRDAPQKKAVVGKIADRVGRLERRPLLQAATMAKRGSPVTRTDELHMQCIIEQVPQRESRIELGSRRDLNDVPVPVIDWRIADIDRRTIRWTAEAFQRYCVAVGLPIPTLDEWIFDETSFRLPDVAHPMGTIRMATSALDGAVDPHCTVFGVSGLCVAGSAVFPTGGHANPTLTIVALAIRLADRITVQILRDRLGLT